MTRCRVITLVSLHVRKALLAASTAALISDCVAQGTRDTTSCVAYGGKRETQYIPVYHSISQYTTVYHSILQNITVYSSISQYITVYPSTSQYTTVYSSIRQYITVYPSTSQYTPVYHSIHSISQYITVYHSILQTHRVIVVDPFVCFTLHKLAINEELHCGLWWGCGGGVVGVWRGCGGGVVRGVVRAW